MFNPQTILAKTPLDYTSEFALKWTASKISDEFLAPNFKKPKSESEIIKMPAIPPQETLMQKVSNVITFSGAIVLTLGIIVFRKKGKSG
ncbi:MAG: hypothetical protein A3E40_03850 [Candidatus Levybacteria bacterium RIFCSPHIGHO2_12_FULL_37_9]|nr:MAG: hypothetical protein A3E40_03850 [Candidatus Levybacteria bacterium RIFCSPHIGHO2_12_FULL_37_9]